MDGIAYCGPAPVPETLSGAWNLDPLLIPAGALLVACLALTGCFDRGRGRLPLSAAMLVLAVAFVSPLCAASTALFSARVLHHVLLVAIAAPLLALAFPARGWFARLPLGLLFGGHALAMWVWHAPVPYLWALSSTSAY